MNEELKSIFDPVLASFAFVGALLRLTFWPVTDRVKAWSTTLTATILSLISSPIIYQVVVWHWPEFPKSQLLLWFIGFWFALFGVQLVPIVSSLLSKLRDSKLPGGE